MVVVGVYRVSAIRTRAQRAEFASHFGREAGPADFVVWCTGGGVEAGRMYYMYDSAALRLVPARGYRCPWQRNPDVLFAGAQRAALAEHASQT